MSLSFIFLVWCFVLSLAQRAPIVASVDSSAGSKTVEPDTPPEILPNDSRLTIEAGQNARLTCQAKGVPRPKVTWTRPRGQLLPSGQESTIVRTLVISKARPEDAGDYVCTAVNGVGKPATRKVTLEVEFPPTIGISKPRIAQALGYNADLTCRIEALPVPLIHWMKGNETIKPTEGEFEIAHFTKKETSTIESTLTIHYLTGDEYGTYSCHASNKLGSASGSVELYQSKIPICPPVCGYTDLTNSATTNTLFLQSLASVSIFWLLIRANN